MGNGEENSDVEKTNVPPLFPTKPKHPFQPKNLTKFYAKYQKERNVRPTLPTKPKSPFKPQKNTEFDSGNQKNIDISKDYPTNLEIKKFDTVVDEISNLVKAKILPPFPSTKPKPPANPKKNT